MKIRIFGDDDEHQIIAHEYDDPENALRAHGFNPDQIEIEIELNTEERLDELETQ